ncbi:MAG: universal stress protein [Pseudomonadota bacterium]
MMKDTKKILFATDLSVECRNSYNYAVHLAMARQGSISLLHVIEAPSVSLETRVKNLFGENRYEEIMRAHEDDARSVLIGKRKEGDILQSALSKFCEETMSSHPGCFLQPDEIIVKKGEVAKEIVLTAEEKECDMILLSSHKGWTTSVSMVIRDVLLLSKVPVIIVPPTGN